MDAPAAAAAGGGDSPRAQEAAAQVAMAHEARVRPGWQSVRAAILGGAAAMQALRQRGPGARGGQQPTTGGGRRHTRGEWVVMWRER